MALAMVKLTWLNHACTIDISFLVLAFKQIRGIGLFAYGRFRFGRRPITRELITIGEIN